MVPEVTVTNYTHIYMSTLRNIKGKYGAYISINFILIYMSNLYNKGWTIKATIVCPTVSYYLSVLRFGQYWENSKVVLVPGSGVQDIK